MAKGQKTFSTQGREVQKRMEFKPLAPGEYELKLIAKNFEIKAKQGPGSLPYVNGFLEALGTGGDTGKNRRVYHRLFLDTTPSKKDGVAMVDRGAGLVALANAVGTPLEGVSILPKQKQLDDGTLEDHEILNPKEVMEYLSSIDGSVISGKVKVIAGDPNYGPKNEIEYFIETEAAETDEDEDEDDDEEEDGEADDDEETSDDEDEDEDDEDEDVPAPKSKVKQGPAGKKALKKVKR